MFTTRPDQLDDLLALTCEELQLPPSWHDEADRNYQAVCAWLEAEDSPLRQYHPALYPQGSFRIGTTVHPIGRDDEYDLDFVCQLDLDWRHYTPQAVLDMVEHRLRANGNYAKMIKRLNRCVRLIYARRFHLDVLPASPEIPPQDTCVRVPDRKLAEWKASNPKGYAAWFEQRCGLYQPARALRAEPVPNQESASDKTPLQLLVQLLKRARDLQYRRLDRDLSPRSIVLTTMAGLAYRGEESTSAALTAVLDGMLVQVEGRPEPLEVRNPTNAEEILSEKWIENPASYRLFVRQLRAFRNRWQEALEASGPEAVAILEELFGEETKTAYRRQIEGVNAARTGGTLRASLGSGILSTSSPRSTPVRPNTFYGDRPVR